MKVRLTSIYASPMMSAQPGSIVDFPEDEARALIAGKFGVPIADTAVASPEETAAPAPAAEETASTAAPETAARRTGGRSSRSRTAAPAPETPTE